MSKKRMCRRVMCYSPAGIYVREFGEDTDSYIRFLKQAEEDPLIKVLSMELVQEDGELTEIEMSALVGEEESLYE